MLQWPESSALNVLLMLRRVRPIATLRLKHALCLPISLGCISPFMAMPVRHLTPPHCHPTPQYLDGISKASRKSFQEAGAQLGEAAEQRYLLALQQLGRLLEQRREAAAAAEAALAPEAARAAAAQARADAQRSAFLQLATDVAAACTAAAAAGQPRAALPPASLQRFLEQHPVKAAEGRVLRAACDRLTHQLSAAEARLKAGDQLSGEGLHLVDYEQLRIEAASLAAKREARAAEVEKLRGKLAAAVQVGWGSGCDGAIVEVGRGPWGSYSMRGMAQATLRGIMLVQQNPQQHFAAWRSAAPPHVPLSAINP